MPWDMPSTWVQSGTKAEDLHGQVMTLTHHHHHHQWNQQQQQQLQEFLRAMTLEFRVESSMQKEVNQNLRERRITFWTHKEICQQDKVNLKPPLTIWDFNSMWRLQKNFGVTQMNSREQSWCCWTTPTIKVWEIQKQGAKFSKGSKILSGWWQIEENDVAWAMRP